MFLCPCVLLFICVWFVCELLCDVVCGLRFVCDLNRVCFVCAVLCVVVRPVVCAV